MNNAASVSGVGFRVRYLDDGRTLLIEFAEEFHDLLGLGRVQVARRFVGQQQRGFMNDSARDPNQLLLTAGELAWE
jgi:hypothetical protein